MISESYTEYAIVIPDVISTHRKAVLRLRSSYYTVVLLRTGGKGRYSSTFSKDKVALLYDMLYDQYLYGFI